MSSKDLHEKTLCQFIWKLKDMIQKHDKIIGWNETGEEIIVHSASVLEEEVLPHYFRHSNFRSFVRQLNMYGFGKKIKEGDTLVFSHKIFRKGNDANFSSIQRKTKPRTERSIQAKFQKENSEILSKIHQNKTIDSGAKMILISLIQYKERSAQNLKRIRRDLERLCRELKDTRIKKVIENVNDIKNNAQRNLQKQIAEVSSINQYIISHILKGEVKSQGIPLRPRKNSDMDLSLLSLSMEESHQENQSQPISLRNADFDQNSPDVSFRDNEPFGFN